jgi:hypothetical protein
MLVVGLEGRQEHAESHRVGLDHESSLTKERVLSHSAVRRARISTRAGTPVSSRRMRRALNCVVVAAIALASWALGMATRDAVVYRATDYWCRGGSCGFDQTRDREPVECARFGARTARTAVLLTAGQSNAANYGQMPVSPREGVYNFNWFDGRCYRARDPLLGADGNGGSVWTRLGDLLVSRGSYDQVLIAPIAVGGSALSRWIPGGDLHRRLVETRRRLQAAGIEVTHVLWHQGERDAELGTSAEQYTEQFGKLVASLRGLGIGAPVFAALASACGGPPSETIRAAQLGLPLHIEGVRRGPDTDSLANLAYRYDACHFSDAGLDAHARLWLDAVWPRS